MSPKNNDSSYRLPEPLMRLLGRHAEDTQRGMDIVTGKLKAGLKRAGFHLLALLAGGIIARGENTGEAVAFFYFGAICLFPRGFSLRSNSYLVPFVISAGQLILTLLMGYPPYLSLALAGTQSWLLRAVIRRFRLGLDWVPALFLLAIFVEAATSYDLPLVFLGLTTLCGLGAYYAARALDKRKLRKLEAEALAKAENASPFNHFYISVSQLEDKSAGLPAGLQEHTLAITIHGRNILGCMAQDAGDVQPGTRFLGRYLPAAHKIVDEYVRLGSEGGGHEDIDKVLDRVDETLERLAGAFQAEHGKLLRNDAIQLGAELGVLDKLLKMDGK